MIRLAGVSLRTRLLAGALTWIAVTLIVTGLVLTALFRAHAERRFDVELATHLDQLLASLRAASDGTLSLAHPMTDPRFQRPYSALYWQVDGPTGPLLRSRSLWDQALPLPRDTPGDAELHRHLLTGPEGQRLVAVERRVRLPGMHGVVRAAVAGDLDVVNRATRAFARTTALALGTLALGLLVAVAIQAFGTLRPLGRLQAELAAVRAGRAARLAGRFPAELQPLVDGLNGLLAHDAAVLAQARTEAGNLAHTLKTPLAVIVNATGALPGGEATAMVADQARLMARRIDYALTRARAAASGRVLGATTAVAPLIERMAQAMRTLHADRGIVVDAHAEGDCVAQIEEQDCEEILGNLLDNACKWGRTRVAIAARAAEARVVVTIDDDGPGLPEVERERVFLRGEKLDERAEGAGLGLSIVRDLTATYDGSIGLDSSPLGGLRAVLSLPRAAA